MKRRPGGCQSTAPLTAAHNGPGGWRRGGGAKHDVASKQGTGLRGQAGGAAAGGRPSRALGNSGISSRRTHSSGRRTRAGSAGRPGRGRGQQWLAVGAASRGGGDGDGGRRRAAARGAAGHHGCRRAAAAFLLQAPTAEPVEPRTSSTLENRPSWYSVPLWGNDTWRRGGAGRQGGSAVGGQAVPLAAAGGRRPRGRQRKGRAQSAPPPRRLDAPSACHAQHPATACSRLEPRCGSPARCSARTRALPPNQSRLKAQESRIKTQDSRTKNQGSRHQQAARLEHAAARRLDTRDTSPCEAAPTGASARPAPP